LIVIDKILISDEIIEEQFVCDLNKCKGGCCEDGDSGAPLATEELEEVKKAFEIIKPFLTAVGLKELERTGLYRYDREFGWVTPTVNGEICAYGYRDKKGIIKCAFEEAYNQKLISWKKPISCHLYPIRTKQSKYNDYEMMNYEPRETLCSPACELGKQLKVPVYQFLKESITRKYGQAFYIALEKIASEYFEKQK
jgi:Protein of unknown function (DUF3109)